MQTPRAQNARFVWFDNHGTGRNIHGLFRKTISVDTTITSAVLHIFADTHYQLSVNGVFVEFGPVRFDPRFPQYDTHDLSPHLRQGTNVIAVLVNYFGHKTFKSIPANAGMITWGSIECSNGHSLDLSTRSGTWRCAQSKAYLYAPKMSFALNATERFSQEHDFPGWRETSFNDSAWENCVELDKQDAWGPLEPRTIPLMSGHDVPIQSVRAIHPLRRNEDWYSFTVETNNYGKINSSKKPQAIAFKTWIYSPRAQDLTVGTFWSDSWINGKKLPMGIESNVKSLRYAQPWKLEQGWNFLCGYIELYQDIVDHYLAIPRDHGLVLSARKEIGSPAAAKYTGLMVFEEIKSRFPFQEGDTFDASLNWSDLDGSAPAQSPCLETGWDEFGDVAEVLELKKLNGHRFTLDLYPQGFALMLDMGEMNLAFPHIRMSGVAGATIDITYSEHLMQDRLHLRHGNGYFGGDRVLCSNDSIDWYPVHPKGMRYLTVTVRGMRSDIVLESLSLRSARYPAKRTGAFECSDPLLTNIWQMCARTLAANMEDAYVDCSGRERGMYLRDTIIQYYVNLAVFGDQTLMKRCMQLYGQSPDSTGKFRAVYPNEGDYTIADFALNMLEGYDVYYRYSNDLDRVRADWPAIQGNLAWFHSLADQRKDLLLDSEWHTRSGVQAHYGGFHGDLNVVKGHLDNTGIHCMFSCTYLIALQSALFLARKIDASTDIPGIERRIAILEKSIPALFWDESVQAFGDNPSMRAHSVHANLFAIRAGVVSEDRLAAVRSHISTCLPSVFVNGYDPADGVYLSPHFAFYLLDGLYRADMPDVAERLIRSGWGWALAQGMPTCPEYFSHHSSLCHAWSASPAWYLSRYVLGISYPSAPDFSKVVIDIKTTSVNHAEGSMPHPDGTVDIKWHREGGKPVFDYVRAPEGVSIEILDDNVLKQNMIG